MSEKQIYQNIGALKPVEILVDEASRAIDDPSRIASDDNGINEALGAAGGIGIGAGIGYAGLYYAGITGLSAAGITSGLGAAGGLIGLGMTGGIAVVAAPAVALGLVGYAVVVRYNKQKLLEKKEMLLQEVLRKHDCIIRELDKSTLKDKDRIEYLTKLNILLQGAVHDLKSDLEVRAA